MDSVGKNPSTRNGNKPTIVDSVKGGNIGEEAEEEDGERKSLLPSVVKGGMAIKSKKKDSRRRVQWNDRNGNKLVEVLEFLPSDSSDSEDEYIDSCICTIM